MSANPEREVAHMTDEKFLESRDEDDEPMKW